MAGQENQLSRFGAISKTLPLMAPNAKYFFVGASSLPSYANFAAEYPVDKDGGTRIFPTLAAAFADSNVVTARGDVLLLLPGHTETITSATSLTLNKSGVQIIGLGKGALRPTITFTTATSARINVTAANISFENCIFVANVAAVVTAFLLTTAPDFEVNNCAFRDTSSILNFVALITTTVSVVADGLVFTNNRVSMLGTTATTTPIKVAGTHSRLTISDNFFVKAVLNNTSCVLAHGALVVTNLEMARNIVFSANTDSATGAFLVTTTSTTNTGMITDNRVKALDVAGALLIPTGAIYGMMDNKYTGDADTSGFVLPAIGTDA